MLTNIRSRQLLLSLNTTSLLNELCESFGYTMKLLANIIASRRRDYPGETTSAS